jgi:PAS domain S-box-containing protein
MNIREHSKPYISLLYRKVLAGSADFVVGIDSSYNYVFANKACLRYLHLTKADIRKRTAPEILGIDLFKKDLKPHLDQILNGKRVNLEMPFMHPELGSRSLWLSGYPVKLKGFIIAVIVARDITKHKQLDQSLSQYRQIYNAIMKNSDDFFILLDSGGFIRACSRQITVQTGLSPETLKGQSIGKLLHRKFYRTMARYLKYWHTHHGRQRTWEASISNREKQTIVFRINSIPVYENNQLKWVLCLACNIAEQTLREETLQLANDKLNTRLHKLTGQAQAKLQRMEERLKQISLQLMDVREKERNIIGRELHDELGGHLIMLKLSLHNLAKQPKLKDSLVPVQQAVNEMVDRVRAFSHTLCPPLLEQIGLLESLLSYFENYQNHTGIQIDFNHRGLQTRLPLRLEAIAYHIIQEALTNAAKYAGVGSVKVVLWRSKDIIKIHIEDKGRGFDFMKIEAAAYGLAGMKYHALAMGGTLEVNSAPGQGTSITASLPVPRSKETKTKPGYPPRLDKSSLACDTKAGSEDSSSTF